jgi:DNA polymerase sigma
MIMFGSQANGLALDSSDMDVAVLGLAITDQDEIISCMYEMLGPLKESQFVETVKIIETASVPLIKLKLNL